MRRLILHGLHVDEFIHPDEKNNKKRALRNSTLQKALSSAANFCHIAIEPITQGTFVKINETCSTDLIKILHNVCTILEVESIPEIYICHLLCTTTMALGSTEKAYLVIPDYVLNNFDEDMLYYDLGNVVTMLKADHVGISTLAAYIPGGGLIEIPKLLFNAYLHSADSTSDRGGLLSCQSWCAAARCQLFELGISPKISRQFFSTDKEAEDFVEKYLDEQKRVVNKYNRILIRAARTYQNLTYIEAPANKMLRELFDWYKNPKGYQAVISKHGSDYL